MKSLLASRAHSLLIGRSWGTLFMSFRLLELSHYLLICFQQTEKGVSLILKFRIESFADL